MRGAVQCSEPLSEEDGAAVCERLQGSHAFQQWFLEYWHDVAWVSPEWNAARHMQGLPVPEEVAAAYAAYTGDVSEWPEDPVRVTAPVQDMVQLRRCWLPLTAAPRRAGVQPLDVQPPAPTGLFYTVQHGTERSVWRCGVCGRFGSAPEQCCAEQCRAEQCCAEQCCAGVAGTEQCCAEGAEGAGAEDADYYT